MTDKMLLFEDPWRTVLKEGTCKLKSSCLCVHCLFYKYKLIKLCSEIDAKYQNVIGMIPLFRHQKHIFSLLYNQHHWKKKKHPTCGSNTPTALEKKKTPNVGLEHTNSIGEK